MRHSHAVEDFTAEDGTTLALHRWLPSDGIRTDAVVFYIHGIQSHAGWLKETGAALACAGAAMYALDRRGSGRSGGTRGDLRSPEIVLDDYRRALATVTKGFRGLELTVIGQSFGGSILAALAVRDELPAERLIYCAPALGQQRARRSEAELDDLRCQSGLDTSELNLRDEDYTSVGRYLDLMANDAYLLRSVTRNTRSTMVGIEDEYFGSVGETAASVHFAIPEQDAIIDLEAAEEVLATLHPHYERKTFATGSHYIEFSSVGSEYRQWLCDLIRGSVDEARL